jgi:hypothetical protein
MLTTGAAPASIDPLLPNDPLTGVALDVNGRMIDDASVLSTRRVTELARAAD